ncbi:late competence development ComFB family protein [Paenibacillus sp. S-38]|uniref:late competence development ComFB family protein n=1 Tax=Paenibacillus sp. S-38 TaxID=3416710 RepID=UPI003CE9D652
MEEIVETFVDVLLTGPEYQTFCKCKKCRNDTIAYSLNSLPPQYATNDVNRDRIFERYSSNDMRAWINKRIIIAVHLVAKFPKHELSITE